MQKIHNIASIHSHSCTSFTHSYTLLRLLSSLLLNICCFVSTLNINSHLCKNEIFYVSIENIPLNYKKLQNFRLFEHFKRNGLHFSGVFQPYFLINFLHKFQLSNHQLVGWRTTKMKKKGKRVTPFRCRIFCRFISPALQKSIFTTEFCSFAYVCFCRIYQIVSLFVRLFNQSCVGIFFFYLFILFHVLFSKHQFCFVSMWVYPASIFAFIC